MLTASKLGITSHRYLGKMAKTIIVFLALSVFVAHCYVVNGPKSNKPRLNKSGPKRDKRSCHVCEDTYGPPPPPPPPGHPPPPPYFRTQNWSGLARSADGFQQGVFSGAAAAADLVSQNAGQAFSVASSSTGAGASGQASDNSDSPSAGREREHSTANAQSQSEQQFEGQHLVRSSGKQKFGSSDHYKESQNNYHSGGSQNFENHVVSAADQGYEGQQQVQGSQGGFRGSVSGGASSAQAYNAGSGSSEKAQSGGGFGYGRGRGVRGSAKYSDEQQVQTSGGEWNSGSSSNSASSYQGGAATGAGNVGSGVSGGGSAGSGQEALTGALNLASQGLQTAQQTGSSGCSTCGKSSYALSNAKSHSGNAIALSIGG